MRSILFREKSGTIPSGSKIETKKEGAEVAPSTTNNSWKIT